MLLSAAQPLPRRTLERGVVRTATSNESGAYNLTRLPVGTYSLKVSAPGFQTTSYPPFVLVLNQVARIDAEMKVGQVSRDGRSYWRRSGSEDRSHAGRYHYQRRDQRQSSAGLAQLLCS